jgi:MFS family permease
MHAATTSSDDPRTAAATGARAALVLLLAINLFNYIDRQVLAAVLPEIQKEFLAKDPHADQKAGWLATAFLVSYMLTSPVFGFLADRVSRWKLIAFGVILWSLASGASGLAGSFVILLITRLFVGIGEAAYGPAAPTLLSDLYPVRTRGKVLSWFYVAIPVGGALGYVLGGAVAAVASWHWAFLIVVPPGVLLGAWALMMKEPPRGSADAVSHSARPQFRDYLLLFRTRSYVLNTAAMTAMTFAIGGVATWMPKYVLGRLLAQDPARDPKATLATANLIFGGITVVGGIAGTLAGGWAGDRLRGRFPGSYFLVSAAGMLVGFPFFLLMLKTPFPLNWAVIFLVVFCLFFNTGPSNTALANVTHPSMRATGFALNILIIHLLGDAISPPVMGAISDRWSMNAAFATVSGMVLLGGLLWLFGAPFLGRDVERASTLLNPQTCPAISADGPASATLSGDKVA